MTYEGSIIQIVAWSVLGDVGVVLASDDEFRLGAVRVGRKPPWLPPPPSSADREAMASEAAHLIAANEPIAVRSALGMVANGATRPHYETGSYFWIDTGEGTPERALRHVGDFISGRVAAALSIEMGGLITAQVRFAYEREPGGAMNCVEQPEARRTRYLLKSYEPNAEGVREAYQTLNDNAAMSDAALYIERARQHADGAAYFDALADPAILEYARIVELLVRHFGQPERDAETKAGQLAKVLARLQDQLALKTQPAKRLAALKEAYRETQRIESFTREEQLRFLAERLQLDRTWVRQAEHLTQIRNARLAHPGKPLTRHERELILEGDAGSQADRVAVSALAGAARYVASERDA